ncbi:MAG: hypothetical protein GX325_06925 [Peptococcaceae bacterium]|nr:hypothetical protein [Peptococcaceae bacterium]
MTLLLLFPQTSSAAALNKAIFIAGDKNYVINNAIHQASTAPYLVDGRFLAPYKEAAAVLGIDENNVFWDTNARTIEIHSANLELKFTIGDKTIYVNGVPRSMDAAPVDREGQVFLPLKWLAEALGYAVDWEARWQAVLLGPPGQMPLWRPLPTALISPNVRTCEFAGGFLPGVHRLSTSSVAFVGEYANVFNAGVAARQVDGYVLEPNRVFSFNRVVGVRSSARGYIKGYDILDNLTFGGGVCRTSTVLYQAARGAGLEIIERHPHYLPVHYTPVGTDASVNYGTMDLRFRNNLGVPILIKAGLEERGNSRLLWAELWVNKPLTTARVAILRKEPGDYYQDNLEPVGLTALIWDDRSYVSLEQLSDLLGLPLEMEERGGQQYARLGLNGTQSMRCIANNKNAVVNNHEFQLDSPPFWLPAGSCQFWVPLRNWAGMIGADVNWNAHLEPPLVLNLSGCAL